MKLTRKKVIGSVVAALVAVATLAACTSLPSAQDQAVKRSQTRANYVPQNDVEGRNYNARQRLADDPSTIIWCSFYPNSSTAKPFTVPIVGKLTSGNKRPYPTSQFSTSDSSNYSPELPGTDGFYGSSSDYLYGFDPAGVYWQFPGTSDLPCTSAPTLIQKQNTTFSVSIVPSTASDAAAQAALKACQKTSTDPSVPCPAAARILGAS